MKRTTRRRAKQALYISLVLVIAWYVIPLPQGLLPGCENALRRPAPDALADYSLERDNDTIRIEHAGGPKLHRGKFTENLSVSVWRGEDEEVTEYQWYPPRNGAQGDEFSFELPEGLSNSSELSIVLVWSGYTDVPLPWYCPRKMWQLVGESIREEEEREPTGVRTVQISELN